MPILRQQLVVGFHRVGESVVSQLAALSTLLVSPFLLPREGLGVSTCWWRTLFGVNCQSCGLTRSFIALTHGHIIDSFAFHPIGPPLFALLALLWVDRVYRLTISRPLFAYFDTGSPFSLAGVAIVLSWPIRLVWSWYIA